MSKPILGKILSRTEVPMPRLVLITDSSEVSGRGVTCALVKSHILAGSKLQYLTTAVSPNRLNAFFKEEQQDDSVEQLIVCCGRDCVPEYVISSLTHVALAVIHVQPSTPCQCKITLKKPSGKVVQSHEEFTLSTDLKVEDNRTIEKNKGPKEDNSDVDAILAAQTTFSLSLTEDQRRSKNMLLLPHTRIQSSGGQIHYTPDDSDDWDEEDPDDDLDI